MAGLAAAGPSPRALTPRGGPVTGATLVTVLGDGFGTLGPRTHNAKCAFDAVRVAATIIDGSHLACAAPACEAAAVVRGLLTDCRKRAECGGGDGAILCYAPPMPSMRGPVTLSVAVNGQDFTDEASSVSFEYVEPRPLVACEVRSWSTGAVGCSSPSPEP